jgi:hypothetical protein
MRRGLVRVEASGRYGDSPRKYTCPRIGVCGPRDSNRIPFNQALVEGSAIGMYPNMFSPRFVRAMVGTMALALVLSACADSSPGLQSDEAAEIAARVAVTAWGFSRGVDVRDIDAVVLTIFDDGADVRVTSELYFAQSDALEDLQFVVPVSREEQNRWVVPSVIVIDRLVASARTSNAVRRASLATLTIPIQTPVPPSPSPSPAPSPTPELPAIPPPPEGTVAYESDWSDGIDGWIGASDWQVADSMLLNDGSRQGREPWIEAPVQVDPWKDMIVEFQILPLADGFGSFGLIARGSDSGWFELGVRQQEDEVGSGTPVVTLGANVRRSAQRIQEEWFTNPVTLTPDPHLFRFEFIAGEISMFIDGAEVGEIQDGTFATGEFIGLWSERTPLQVQFFRVTVI